MTRLILYLVLALGTSFFCSFLEAVLLSATPTYIEILAKGHGPAGRIIKSLKANMNRSLSAILTINSVAQIMGSAAVGAEMAKIFGDDSLAVGSMVLTFLMLFVTEIMPKVLGVNYWKATLLPAAYVIRIMILISYPLVVFFEMLSKFISRGRISSPKWTRDEMVMAAEMGQTEGTLVEKETKVIRNILRLNLIYVKDVMTPAESVFALSKSASVEEVVEMFGHEFYSRVPIYDGAPSEVVGLVLRFNIFNAESDDMFDMKMSDLMSPIHEVRSSQTLAKVLDEFILRREHLFAVVDENQRFCGVISLEDVIETLLGVEIEDEIDNAEQMREQARKQWEERLKQKHRPTKTTHPATLDKA